MGALGGDGGDGLRGGLAKQEFKTMLDEGSTKVCPIISPSNVAECCLSVLYSDVP